MNAALQARRSDRPQSVPVTDVAARAALGNGSNDLRQGSGGRPDRHVGQMAVGTTAATSWLSTSPVSRAPSASALLDPLRKLSAIDRNLDIATAGTVSAAGVNYEIPRLHFVGPAAGRDPIRLGLFAGIHGDEPAGCLALVEFAAALAGNPARAAGYELFLYPLINPAGFERGTRTNHAGKDLNREFWRDSSEAEVTAIETELRTQNFAGIITLHADDTSEGVYGYAHGRTLNEALLGPALEAAKRFLPIDARAVIDGFPASAGLIRDCFSGVLAAPPEQQPKPFDLIFETPARASLDLQVAATVAALETIIAVYPGFISYAQDL